MCDKDMMKIKKKLEMLKIGIDQIEMYRNSLVDCVYEIEQQRKVYERTGLKMEEQYKGYVESFKWWAEPKKIISQPGRLYCDRYMITGEIDLLLDTREGLVLVDLKTPAKEGKTWNLQGSAYSYLCKKNDFDVSKILFVKLAKNGDYPKVYEYIENMPKFVKCLEIYREFFKNDSDIVDEDFL